MRDSLRVARSADRAYGDHLINCLVGLERFAEEPRIVLRLAEYMSGGVLARRDSETRRVLQAVFTERMEFAPFNEGETRGYQFAGPGSYGGILLGDTCPTPGSLVCNCGYARFRAPRCAS